MKRLLVVVALLALVACKKVNPGPDPKPTSVPTYRPPIELTPTTVNPGILAVCKRALPSGTPPPALAALGSDGKWYTCYYKDGRLVEAPSQVDLDRLPICGT
jgi:hypothetical protein